MAKRKNSAVKTTFEQVPVRLARKIAEQEFREATAGLVSCALCGDPVALELCKIDEFGKAVHQNCYLNSLKTRDQKTRNDAVPVKA